MTRIRGGRGIAQVCGRNETSRTAREPGRRRHGADETNRHDCGADEPAEPGRGRERREQPAAGQVSDHIGSLEPPTARQGY